MYYLVHNKTQQREQKKVKQILSGKKLTELMTSCCKGGQWLSLFASQQVVQRHAVKVPIGVNSCLY